MKRLYTFIFSMIWLIIKKMKQMVIDKMKCIPYLLRALLSFANLFFFYLLSVLRKISKLQIGKLHQDKKKYILS